MAEYPRRPNVGSKHSVFYEPQQQSGSDSFSFEAHWTRLAHSTAEKACRLGTRFLLQASVAYVVDNTVIVTMSVGRHQ